MPEITQITSYTKTVFTAPLRNGATVTHDIYTHGTGKKVVILIQEMPGIGQETLALADRFVEKDYTVVLPHLFGPIGKTATFQNTLSVLCMRKEFKMFASNESSPIVDFLSALSVATKQRLNVKGVAVIGMCLTGNFAISLLASEAVLAGFASQPSMPLFKSSKLHMNGTEIETIKNKLDQIGPMHCGRFKKDIFCTKRKFEAFDKAFNTDTKKRIIFHELPGKGHSILTLDFVDQKGHPSKQAFTEVLQYFDSALS